MKGLIPTSDLMHAIINEDNGLRTGRMMSHVVFKEIPNYHKIICLTDAAIIPYPDIEQNRLSKMQ